MFSNKKNFDDDKIFFINRFFESNRNFTTENVKIVKIPGFFSDFCSKLQVFPGFFQNYSNSRFFKVSR